MMLSRDAKACVASATAIDARSTLRIIERRRARYAKPAIETLKQDVRAGRIDVDLLVTQQRSSPPLAQRPLDGRDR